MAALLSIAVAGNLPGLFSQSRVPPYNADIGQALETASRRWPSLQRALDCAAELVRAQSVYKVPARARELALVKLPAEWRFRAVSPTLSGLGCTCRDWPPVPCAGPGDGLYCADILAYLLALYLQWPFAPLPYTPDELWQTVLEALRLQMTRASFNQWLLGSFVVREASTPLSLTVALRHRYAQEWLTHRLHAFIVRTLVRVAGYEVQVRFLVL